MSYRETDPWFAPVTNITGKDISWERGKVPHDEMQIDADFRKLKWVWPALRCGVRSFYSSSGLSDHLKGLVGPMRIWAGVKSVAPINHYSTRHRWWKGYFFGLFG